MAKRRAAWLALEDGTVFEGLSFGAAGETAGEVVFNTSMAGYQEVLTDPSYKGQLVAMTVAHVGNYGITPADAESVRPQVDGFIVREACSTPSNWRSRESFPDYLARHGIVGIEGIDTRALVVLLRTKGALRGVISGKPRSVKVLVEKAVAHPRIEEQDLVSAVTCREPFEWHDPVQSIEESSGDGGKDAAPANTGGSGDSCHVVVVDCGVKRNILRSLVSAGCRVTVVPAFTSASQIADRKPDGVMFSNGPGDPERLSEVVAAARDLIGKFPVFGICLGHQVIGRALGARTYKLKFGHHGGNQPVMDLGTRAVAITVQNHNFAIEESTLPADVTMTHVNLNDRTVEGQRHRGLPVASVQYHPESSPGPHDAAGQFAAFVKLMRDDRSGGAGQG